MQHTIITNARLATPEAITAPATVIVKNGVIHNVQQQMTTDDVHDEKNTVDAKGQLLIPGMIDMHIHGAHGRDMMDGTTESIEEVSRACALTGCTSFLVTSVSSSLQDVLTMIQNVKQVIGHEPGAKIAGIHLEGPYLNAKRKGMQNEKYLRHPDQQEMQHILHQAGDLIKMVTIAPELPGGMDMVQFLQKQNIIVAIAHSDADFAEAKQAFALGASHITHCFNGMRPIHHRDPGVVTAAFDEPEVSLQAIVDNIHLHPAIVRLMHRIKGAEGVALITDALQAMLLGDGTYDFGGHQVFVKNGVARLHDGTLASSTVTMIAALHHTIDNGIPVLDAVHMASQTPANILGLTQRGRLNTGSAADLVLLDETKHITWTMIDGHIYPSPT